MALERKGTLNDTMVVFTSDHGYLNLVVTCKYDHCVVQHVPALKSHEDPPRLSSTPSNISTQPIISSSDVAVLAE